MHHLPGYCESKGWHRFKSINPIHHVFKLWTGLMPLLTLFKLLLISFNLGECCKMSWDTFGTASCKTNFTC